MCCFLHGTMIKMGQNLMQRFSIRSCPMCKHTACAFVLVMQRIHLPCILLYEAIYVHCSTQCFCTLYYHWLHACFLLQHSKMKMGGAIPNLDQRCSTDLEKVALARIELVRWPAPALICVGHHCIYIIRFSLQYSKISSKKEGSANVRKLAWALDTIPTGHLGRNGCYFFAKIK
jgi:hypothetical protein